MQVRLASAPSKNVASGAVSAPGPRTTSNLVSAVGVPPSWPSSRGGCSSRLGSTKDWIEKDVALPEFQPVAYIVPGAPDDCAYQSGLKVSELVDAKGNDMAQANFQARAPGRVEDPQGRRSHGPWTA